MHRLPIRSSFASDGHCSVVYFAVVVCGARIRAAIDTGVGALADEAKLAAVARLRKLERLLPPTLEPD